MLTLLSPAATMHVGARPNNVNLSDGTVLFREQRGFAKRRYVRRDGGATRPIDTWKYYGGTGVKRFRLSPL